MKGKKLASVYSKILLFVGAFSVLGAYAVDTRTWTDATGNHLWTDKRNWSPSIVGNLYNIFPAGDWEVIIDDIGELNYYYSLELSEGSGTVTIKDSTGSNYLRPATDGYIKIPSGRELNIDGPQLVISITDISSTGFIDGTLRLTSGYLNTGKNHSKTFGGNAKIVVDGGIFGNKETSGTLTFTNNATLTINGGLAKIWRGVFCSPDSPLESIVRVRMTGGTYWNSEPQYTSYTTFFSAGAHFVNNGGTVMWGQDQTHTRTYLSSEPIHFSGDNNWGQGEAFAGLLPSFGSSLILPTASTSGYGALYFAVDGNYDVGGTIYATNNSSAAAGNVYFSAKNVSLRGGATLYANAYKVNSYKVSINDLDIARLNLGIGGFRRLDGDKDGNSQTVNFLDGIAFGAWGGDVPCAEFPVYNGYRRLKIFLNGPVVYDTQDCFDPATSRTINMDAMNLDGVTDLKVTGGGTVALYPAEKWGEEFRTIEVTEGTALSFCTNAGLKSMNLKLGADAKLKISMKNGVYVDASATATFGEGAKIVVTDLPAPLVDGRFYPVYFAPAGTDPDLSRIEYAGGEWPTGWSLAKRGNAVYLTDGKETQYDEPRSGSTRIWSGAGCDNDYWNSDNWVSNSIAGSDYSVNQAHFKGLSNTVIFVTNDLALRYFEFGSEAGPFMFSGSQISFRYPEDKESFAESVESQTVLNRGKFPVVIANAIKHRVTEIYPTQWLLFRAFGEGSIALTGGSAASHPIAFGGDVRLGGTWTSDCLRCIAKKTVRNARLTVMPGATLSVTAQYGDFNEYGHGALAVADGATAVIDGTDLTFSSNNTHYVDGALTLNCPLVPCERQTFRGDGTLSLLGGVEGASGGVRVEGNLTVVPPNWVNDAVLSVKDNVTIAPVDDWTFGGDARLELKEHSTLTIATGGHKVNLGGVRKSEGSLAVTGGGVVTLASAMNIGKVTLADGSKLAVAKELYGNELWIKALTVREDDESIAFDVNDVSKIMKCVEEDGRTSYLIKRDRGTLLIFR